MSKRWTFTLSMALVIRSWFVIFCDLLLLIMPAMLKKRSRCALDAGMLYKIQLSRDKFGNLALFSCQNAMFRSTLVFSMRDLKSATSFLYSWTGAEILAKSWFKFLNQNWSFFSENKQNLKKFQIIFGGIN